MKVKSALVAIVAACIILSLSTGATVAYLASRTSTLEYIFTYGNVSITLAESAATQYLILPGSDIPKDPTVTVRAGSEDCWLFFKAEKTSDFDRYMTYTPAEGWTALPGETGVYYRRVDATAEDLSFPLMEGNKVTVRDTLTEEELRAVSVLPKLTFTAYAIQQEQIVSPETAWAYLQQEGSGSA